MKPSRYTLFFSLFSAVVPGLAPSLAQAEPINGFDPKASCLNVLSGTGGTTDQMMIAAWTHGYFAARGKVWPISVERNVEIMQKLARACADTPSQSLVALLDKAAGGAAAATPGAPATGATKGAGSAAEARALLNRFAAPGADVVALTKPLLPTPEDIRTVYDAPLSERMIAFYAKAMTPNVAIAPKPGQSEVLTVHAMSGDLKAGRGLDQWPGGYARAAPYFKANVPIVRFKFVRPGETLGMAYDGLVFVNGRWVWMPKPWRALKD